MYGSRLQRRRSAFALVSLFAWGSGGAPAHAADAGDVEALIAEGVELRRSGQDAKALPLFKRAHDLGGTARTAAQLGLVEMELGYRIEAERHLLEALAQSDDFWIRKNRAPLDAALAHLRALLGDLRISGTPAGAEVRVNDRLVGTLPLGAPVRVNKGPITVEVRAPGGRSSRRTLEVAGGGSERLDFFLGDAPVRDDDGPAGDEAALGASAEAGIAIAARAPLSHAGQLGVFLRLDLAVLPESGQRLAPGLSFGLGDRTEIAAAALLGKLNKGAWIGARRFFRDGVVKPALSLGSPIFFADGGLRAGLHGAAGVTVDLGAHAALFADLGLAVFPGASAGDRALWLLPSVGAQGRY